MGLLDMSTWTDTIDRYASQTGLTFSQFSLGLGLSVAALAAGVGLYVFRSDSTKPNPHGPGPKGAFILGNASDLPTGDEPWLDYMKWAKKYGMPRPFLLIVFEANKGFQATLSTFQSWDSPFI